MSWNRKQYYNAGLETRSLSGLSLLYSFLKAFFYCGTLSAPRNAGLGFSYGSNVSKSRTCSEVLWRIEVCKIFLLLKRRAETFDTSQSMGIFVISSTF